MKQFLLFFRIRMVIVLTFGYAVVGFTPVAIIDVSVSADTPASTIPLVSEWILTNWPTSNNFFSLYTNQDKVFARIWESINGGRMFLTTDNGANWTQISSADINVDILSIVMLNSNILAGTWNGFYLSTDCGTTWNTVTPTGIPEYTGIWSVTMIYNTLFAGTTGAIYKSLDNGNIWAEVSSGIPMDARITSIIAGVDAIFAGSACNGIFKTTNDGTSWIEINSGLTDTHISQLAIMDTKLLAVTLDGVFVSDNDGMSWAAGTFDLENINCFLVVNDQLFAGTDDNGVYLSVDGGLTWTSLSSGIPSNTRVWSLAVNSDGMFAGTSYGVWITAPPLVLIKTKIFLEGSYNAGINEMTSTLNTYGFLPLSQPYSGSPWFYSGSESVASGFFSTHNDIVDWVLVELKNASFTTVARRAAFLTSNGTIVDLDGTSPVEFNEIVDGDYYIVVKHRNHLAAMSNVTAHLSNSSSTLYDFTTGSSQFYGGISGAIQIGTSPVVRWGMIAGDTDGNGVIDLTDRSNAWNNRNITDYNGSDTDLSSTVELQDRLNTWNNRNKTTMVP